MMMLSFLYLFYPLSVENLSQPTGMENPEGEIKKWFQSMADQHVHPMLIKQQITDFEKTLKKLGSNYRLHLINTDDVLKTHASSKSAGNGQIPPTHHISKYKLVLAITLPNQDNLPGSTEDQSGKRSCFFLNIPESLAPIIQETLTQIQ